MARVLTAGVLVRHPGSGALTFLPEGAEVPDWADALVGPHVVDGEEEPETAPSPIIPISEVPEDDNDEPPPTSGKGSGRDAWAAYAQANDVTVTGDMDRGDIIAACRAAGVPTE